MESSVLLLSHDIVKREIPTYLLLVRARTDDDAHRHAEGRKLLTAALHRREDRGTATRVVYSVRKDGGAAVFVRPADNAAAAPLEIIAAVPEKVEEMRVFYQSILALRTSSCVHFYFLDPSTAAATSMGSCALPAWSDNRDVRVDVTSSECRRYGDDVVCRVSFSRAALRRGDCVRFVVVGCCGAPHR